MHFPFLKRLTCFFFTSLFKWSITSSRGSICVASSVSVSANTLYVIITISRIADSYTSSSALALLEKCSFFLLAFCTVSIILTAWSEILSKSPIQWRIVVTTCESLCESSALFIFIRYVPSSSSYLSTRFSSSRIFSALASSYLWRSSIALNKASLDA